MKKTVLIFSALIIALLALFQLSQYTYISGDLSIEIVVSVIALIFFFVGVYLNKKSLHKNVSPATAEIDHKKITQLGLSNREYEVLLEIAKGLSNKEIANTLFISESTVKTHVSNILIKLDAKRRTQAITIAKNLAIIPF